MMIEEYLANAPERYRETARALHEFIDRRRGDQPVEVLTNRIVGYGKGEDGFGLLEMSVRSDGVMLYAGASALDRHADALGKSRTGKTCLQFDEMSDVEQEVLDDIVTSCLSATKMDYGN